MARMCAQRNRQLSTCAFHDLKIVIATGLNPFFIRSVFEPEAIPASPRGTKVLIPSLSGLCLNSWMRLRKPRLRVLIPSLSGLCLNIVLRVDDPWWKVLIPSLSGLCLNHRRPRNCREKHRLNPFFIRSVFEPTLCGKKPTRRGLNPFFIRSVFEPPVAASNMAIEVLIPSLSGLCLNKNRSFRRGRLVGLNPFFIRSVFELIEAFEKAAPSAS